MFSVATPVDALAKENQQQETLSKNVTEQECITTEIARRKWNWIGYTFRWKPKSGTTMQVLQ